MNILIDRNSSTNLSSFERGEGEGGERAKYYSTKTHRAKSILFIDLIHPEEISQLIAQRNNG